MRDVGTLLEALPYIREFHGKTVVIKYGGAAMEDAALREEFARDVVLLKYVGLNPIVVHGGGPEITAYMERLGLPVEFVGGLRVSDADDRRGGEDGARRQAQQGDRHAAEPSRPGRDRALRRRRAALQRERAARAPGDSDLGFVGTIEHVNVDVIEHVARDYIPVIASVGADAEGHSYNVNADEAASAVASATHAYKLIFLTDVAGWLRDPARRGEPDRDGERRGGARRALGARGRDAPEARGVLHAIDGGVRSAHIIDGRLEHSLLLELFTDAGIGTKIEARA